MTKAVCKSAQIGIGEGLGLGATLFEGDSSMGSLLLIYFCMAADVCDKYTTNSASFYVGSCNEEFIERQIEHLKNNQATSLEDDVVDYECFKLVDN